MRPLLVVLLDWSCRRRLGQGHRPGDEFGRPGRRDDQGRAAHVVRLTTVAERASGRLPHPCRRYGLRADRGPRPPQPGCADGALHGHGRDAVRRRGRQRRWRGGAHVRLRLRRRRDLPGAERGGADHRQGRRALAVRRPPVDSSDRGTRDRAGTGLPRLRFGPAAAVEDPTPSSSAGPRRAHHRGQILGITPRQAVAFLDGDAPDLQPSGTSTAPSPATSPSRSSTTRQVGRRPALRAGRPGAAQRRQGRHLRQRRAVARLRGPATRHSPAAAHRPASSARPPGPTPPTIASPPGCRTPDIAITRRTSCW